MTLEGMFSFCVHKSWLIPLFPFISFVIISLFTIKDRVLSSSASILGIFLSFLVSLGVILYRFIHFESSAFTTSFNWIFIGDFTVPVGVLIDNLSSMMLLVVSLVAFLIQVYSLGYMEDEKDASFSRYFAYMSLFACAMLGLVLSNNFVQIYIFWELVGLCSYLLIGFWYHKKSAADAAKKAFVVTRFGDLGLLIGIIYIFMNTGTFSFEALQAMVPLMKSSFLTISALLVFSGAVGKSAQFPLHIWLPDAMEGPTPVSALIHAATMVAAGVYLVARTYFLFAASPLALLIVATLGTITAFIAATIAVVQIDIKKVLAYSTISQLGYMMVALGVLGYTAGVFHLMTHAFFKALLFLGAGSVIHAVHTNDLYKMGGLGKKMPLTGITFLMGCLAIAGVPPFSGFFSKDEVLGAVWKIDFIHCFPGYFNANFQSFVIYISYGIKFLTFLAVFLTAFYMFRMYYLAFCGKYRGDGHPHENRFVMTVPLMALSIFALGIGWVGTPIKNYFHEFINFNFEKIGLDIEHLSESHRLLINAPMLISLILALIGICFAYIIYKKSIISQKSLKDKFSAIYAILINKYWMDEIWAGIVNYIVFAGSKILAWVDEYIIDGIVRGIGYLTGEFGIAISREHTGKAQNYILVFIFGILLVSGGLYLLFLRWSIF